MSITKHMPDGTHAGPASGGRPWTLVYDGTCNVCSRLARRVARWDGRHVIQMLASQNDTVPMRFPWISAEEFRESMYLIAADGRTWSGASAARKLLAILPYGFLLGWLWGLPTFGALADRGYRIFARNRYRFGCGEHCAAARRASPPVTPIE